MIENIIFKGKISLPAKVCMRSLTLPKLHSVLTFLNIILRFDTNSTEFYLFLISRRNHRSNEAFEPVHTFSQMTKKIVFLASEVVVILVTHISYGTTKYRHCVPIDIENQESCFVLVFSNHTSPFHMFFGMFETILCYTNNKSLAILSVTYFVTMR